MTENGDMPTPARRTPLTTLPCLCQVCNKRPQLISRFGGYIYECESPVCPPPTAPNHVLGTVEMAREQWNTLNGW